MDKIVERLNYLYYYDSAGYLEYLDSVKRNGWKVYRNSAGKHKVEQNENYIYEAFGGMFGQIFGK